AHRSLLRDVATPADEPSADRGSGGCGYRCRSGILRMIPAEELALRLRRHVVRMCSRGGSSHVGSGLSIADIVAVLYGEVMRINRRRRGGDQRVFVVLSAGEADEGSTWEAAMFAAHHGLGNLRAVIDYNKLQPLGRVSDTINLEPLGAKWRAFGWNALRIDGHDHDALRSALAGSSDRPTFIVADS